MTEISSGAREIRYQRDGQEHSLNLKGVRELKDGMSIEQAAELTKNNGMEEVFFEQNGKRYVAFSEDKLNLENAPMKMDKEDIKVLKLNHEALSFLGGAWDMTKTIGNVALKPFTVIKPLVPNTATAIAFAGGVVTGLMARTGQPAGEYEEIMSMTTRIGIAAGGVIGLSTVKGYTDKESEGFVKTAKSLGTGLAGVGLGMALPDAARLIAKIPIPEFLPKAATAVGIAALSGGAIAVVGAGVAAATKDADLKSIDQIAK